MHHVTQMLDAHPRATAGEALARCVGACFACTQTCTSCADACLGEERAQELVRCIRLNLDSADLCEATGRLLTRQTSFGPQPARATLAACALSCRICAEECERLAEDLNMEHCRLCAEACRRCELACEELLGSIDA